MLKFLTDAVVARNTVYYRKVLDRLAKEGYPVRDEDVADLWPTQQDLASAAGIEGPTLTHHLDQIEKAGMIERSRDQDDRHAVRVELTAAGEERFRRLDEAAVGLDERLRVGLSDDELDAFRGVMRRLLENVGA